MLLVLFNECHHNYEHILTKQN